MMADEIDVYIKLGVTKAAAGLRLLEQAADKFNLTGTRFAHNVQAIGFAAHEALDMNEVSGAGWALFKNLDATNYVQIGVDSTGTFIPFAKLKPGEFALLRLATSAPYAKANTGAVNLQYLILDD